MNQISKILLVLASLWIGMTGVSAVELRPELRESITALEHLHGARYSAKALEGSVVLVSFFASWCPPCHKEFRHLNKFHQKYGPKGLKIVAINYFEDLGGFKDDGVRLGRFLRRYDPAFSVVRGTDDTAKRFNNVERIPTVFIFDRKGKKTFEFIHHYKATKTNPTESELTEVLDRLLP